MSGRGPPAGDNRAALSGPDGRPPPRSAPLPLRWPRAAGPLSSRSARRGRSWTCRDRPPAARWSALPVLRATPGRRRGRGCPASSVPPSCVRGKVLQQVAVCRAEAVGPRGGTIRRRVDLDNGPLAAGVWNGAVFVRAEEAVLAARGTEVLHPEVDAHLSRAEDGVEELDVQIADDMDLIGIVGVIELPPSAVGRIPGRHGPFHVRGKAGVVEHLQWIELVEVNGREVSEARVEERIMHGVGSSSIWKIARTFVFMQEARLSA